MVDTTALVALVVAGVALVVAADQLTLQLMATAYVIRKCDGIVTGGLTINNQRPTELMCNAPQIPVIYVRSPRPKAQLYERGC